ncbi:hypothetical protein CRG98_021321 [Punica granatum]|uniref:Uncharacterized protein n=1 Tax=Punica granatum TaxID=22663 RepID=A0A2I0JPL2_PUNGR|nr:hypothetical protein CRG98_021321 [Punica granatum]
MVKQIKGGGRWEGVLPVEAPPSATFPLMRSLELLSTSPEGRRPAGALTIKNRIERGEENPVVRAPKPIPPSP